MTAEAAAKAASTGLWGTWGSADRHPRYSRPLATPGGPCWCCDRPATHAGCANGAVLMTACEWTARRWVRDYRAVMVERLRRELHPSSWPEVLPPNLHRCDDAR